MFKPHYQSVRSKRTSLCLAGASVLAMTMAQPAFAQTSDAASTSEDEVVAVGTRQVIQDAIALKRNNTQIVDGLSADEIGDIPALSIGEALENITGVASHRENGGATEVSIRGLGPFLSSTVVNGRAATNGSGDRSVNFSQFPSELINKLAVFKTQDATQIEGGVAGQIQLETVKPLEFGKRRLQFEVKGNVNPDQLDQDDTDAGDLGYRFTGSYTDQFELGNGDIGFSIGAQRSDISQPEAEYRETSPLGTSRRACLITDGLSQFIEPTTGGTVTGFSNNPETRRRGDDDCDDVNVEGFDLDDTSGSASPTAEELSGLRNGSGSRVEGFDTSIDPNTGLAVDVNTPFAFIPSQRHFRQNDTRDERDAIFGAVQWQPNDRVDINLDAQYSKRTQSEIRNDLTFNGNLRNDTSLNVLGENVTTLDSLIVSPEGAVTRSITSGNLESQGGDFEREETYLGFGANVAFDITDRWSASVDYGHSNTERTEQAVEFRLRSSRNPVIEFDQTNGDVPQFTLFDIEFDVNDHSQFDENLRIRIDNDLDRENEINSLRFDTKYELDGGFFKDVSAGVRWAEQTYLELDGGDDSLDPLSETFGRFSVELENNFDFELNDFEIIADEDLSDGEGGFIEQAYVDVIANVNQACRAEFPEGNSLLSSVREGDLVTNSFIDDDGNTVTNSTNSFAIFDPNCVAETTVSELNAVLDTINFVLANSGDSRFDGQLGAFSTDIPELFEENLQTIDVEETTTAFYLQTTYEGQIDGVLPISGHIGARVVHTEVDALGYRSSLSIDTADDGTLTLVPGTDLEAIETSHDYTRILPSATAILELSDDKIVRFGVFRALSRADPADLGFSRSFSSRTGSDGEGPTTLNELLAEVSGEGNPEIDPLMSWNYDVSYEWYPNEDSIFALGAYYKQFTGGFNNVVQEETFVFDGEDVVLDVSGIQQVSDDKTNLFGIEFTGTHRFSYLPGLLSGLGAKISYNYAVSDFEFEDSRFGDIFVEQTDGTLVQTNAGIIPPANLPGLSENVLSAQVYYQLGGLDLQVNYKYRDEYFQPFTSDGTRIRYVNDVGVWEARASYKINDNFRLSAEAINIFSEPRSDSAFVIEDVFQVNDYGPRIFFGLRGRF